MFSWPANAYMKDDILTFGRFVKRTVPLIYIASAEMYTGKEGYSLHLVTYEGKTFRVGGNWDYRSTAEFADALKKKILT